jgi:hypothetical protein
MRNIPATVIVTELITATEFFRVSSWSIGWTPNTMSIIAIIINIESPSIYYIRIFYLIRTMSAYADIDANLALLEAFSAGLAPVDQEPYVPEVPYELDESWKRFEKDLGNFKLKLKNEAVSLTSKMGILDELNKNINVSKMIADNITNDELKAKLLSIIDKYESDEGISALTQQCGELKGKIEAMKNVLKGTNPERYAKFTCFVCMERLVDLFIDSCGHVICEPCWVNTRDKRHCPACRGNVAGAKRIFTM